MLPYLNNRQECAGDLGKKVRPVETQNMTKSQDTQLLGYLAAYDPHISDLTLELREIVLEEAPDAIESIVIGYALAIGFSFTGKPLKDGFCHIVTYKTHVNLGFNRGALLPDQNKVLEGKGKAIRHATIRNHRDLERPFVRRYIRAAIEQVENTRGGSYSKSVRRSTKKKSPH